MVSPLANGLMVFGMAAMPFPCNGILLIQGNLLRIFPMSTLRQASFLSSISNYFKMVLEMAHLSDLTNLGGIG